MTIVLDLPRWAPERLRAEAAAQGMEEADWLAALLSARYAASATSTDADLPDEADEAEMTEAERRERATDSGGGTAHASDRTARLAGEPSAGQPAHGRHERDAPSLRCDADARDG